MIKNMSSPLSFLQGLATSLSVWEAVSLCAHGVFLLSRQWASGSAGLAKGISRPPSPSRTGRLSSQKATNQIECGPLGAGSTVTVWRGHESMLAGFEWEGNNDVFVLWVETHPFTDNVKTYQFNVGWPWTLMIKSGLRRLLFSFREPHNESTRKPPNKAESLKEN